MKFFASCNTIEEVKCLYKQLAKDHHPDKGGDTATMQAINVEYAYACAYLVKNAGLKHRRNRKGDQTIRRIPTGH
jgi:curved DNA-binding protein CbpA